MFIIDDRYKNYGLEYTMSYTLTQYQTTPGISRDYVSTFELGSFSANTTDGGHVRDLGIGYFTVPS